MAAPRRCPNGHDWPATVGRGIDRCPVCGATAEIDGTPTLAASSSNALSSAPTIAADVEIVHSVDGPTPVPGYEILGELGRGGMGVVFRARQIKINRVVALKMVLSGELASKIELARFRTEAEAVARLQHPNIVQLYEFGEARSADGTALPYFALEYVSGGNLADRLGGIPQPARSSAKIIEDIARAMHYAHTQGVIHRDLKPANVLLASNSQIAIPNSQTGPGPDWHLGFRISDFSPKVTDFGLAKRMDSSTGHTQSGAVLGTPQYMAPEQAAGKSKRIGPATDIYSLGAILYELLTGRPPFQGESPLETMLQVSRDEPVSPRLLNPAVPRDLETIALKCLQKDPVRRYESAQALAEDLARFLDDQPITARPAGRIERARAWMRRHPTASALMAVTFVAAATFLAMAYGSYRAVTKAYTEAHRRLVEVTIANGSRRADEGDTLMALPWFVEALNLDERNADRATIHRMRLAAALAPPCPALMAAWRHEGPVTAIAYRPDGREVATAEANGNVFIRNPAQPDDAPRPLKHHGEVAKIAYRPEDGKRLLVVGGRTAEIWDPTGGGARTIELNHPDDVKDALWSPDGLRIVTVCGDGSVRVWNAVNGQRTIPLFERHGVRSIALSGDGAMLATGGRLGDVWLYNAATGEAMLPPIVGGDEVKWVALGPIGRELMIASGRTARLWDTITRSPLSIPLNYRHELSGAALSRDGNRVAVVSVDGTGDVWDRKKGDWTDGVLKHGSVILSVAFSPDSQFVATASDDNTARVWSADGSSTGSPPLPHVGSVVRAVFSPDGIRLLTAGEDGMAKLWELRGPAATKDLQDISLTGPKEVTGRNGSIRLMADGDSAQVFDVASGEPLSPPLKHDGVITCVALSPDGNLAATGSADRTARIWNWRAGAQIEHSLTHGSQVNDIIFSPDGRRLATGSGDNTARIWDSATTQPVTPPLTLSGTVHVVRFNPDGKLLLAAGKGLYARIWDAAGGQAIATVPRMEDWVVAALKDANSPIAWPLSTQAGSVKELTELAEWLSGHRLIPGVGLVPIDGDELQKIGRRMQANERPRR